MKGTNSTSLSFFKNKICHLLKNKNKINNKLSINFQDEFDYS